MAESLQNNNVIVNDGKEQLNDGKDDTVGDEEEINEQNDVNVDINETLLDISIDLLAPDDTNISAHIPVSNGNEAEISSSVASEPSGESTSTPSVLNGNIVGDGSNDTDNTNKAIGSLTEKEKKMFTEFLNALITTKDDKKKIDLDFKPPTNDERLEVITKTENAIESLRTIIENATDKSGYVSKVVFKECIKKYDKKNGTTVGDFLTLINQKHLTEIFENTELKRTQVGGMRSSKDTSQEINYNLFLDKLKKVNKSNSNQIPPDAMSISSEQKSSFNDKSSDFNDAKTKVINNEIKNNQQQNLQSNSQYDYNPNTKVEFVKGVKENQLRNMNNNYTPTTKFDASYIPENKTSSSISFFSRQPEFISKNTIVANATDFAKNASETVANASTDISNVVSSISTAADNATNSISSTIFTPAEQMVRDKLITEVSNIARNPGSPDTVNTLTGVINRDLTHADLVIDSKTVMSDVSKTLDGIPDMASKIAYINKLTEMVNRYSDMLEKTLVM